MQILELYRRHRRKMNGLVLAIVMSGGLIAGLMTAAYTGPSDDALRAAAIALDTYYNENPPNGVWRYEGVRIVDNKRLVIDVHVAVVPHATVIESRNKRIRYSYMKLACPHGDPIVERWLEETKLWINLNFHGKTLIEGACPREKQGTLFSS